MDENRQSKYDDWDNDAPLFSKDGLHRIPTNDDEESESVKEVYQACIPLQEGREAKGITFYHPDGAITIQFNTYLSSIVCVPPYERLAIIFMDAVYILVGIHLHTIIPHLKQYRVDIIHCFDERYIAPANEAVIYDLWRESPGEEEENE